ncbi:sugar ABC transporter substrate-binding protein [Enterococcus sp. CWB-B31]|uniref:sugar ABC transporter substrate-binding protein n=1 Tax=Enterococcus sp. CWB-B31 TaxID=2885159 RepID=UPI001E5F9F78|nr:sugar ABC transporter substrate-binding protein [Enterococcus sp. CWB-B31]MCB5954215.1 sugar ABC transporter substrate-binding protein [Enterococcus sp. CWB-B31]
MFKKGKVLLTGMMVATLLLAAGCGKGSSASEESEKTLYFIPIVDTGAYWNPMKKGAEDAAKELGYTLVTKTSPSAEPSKKEKHIGFVKEATAKNVAGIAIAPIEKKAFVDPIKAAMDKDIPVITFDADLENSEDRTAYVGTDNVSAGKELGKQAAEEMKEKGITSGSIAIVCVDVAQPTMIDREKGLKEGFEEVYGSDAKNFKFLATIQDNDQPSESKKQLEGYISANKDLVTVFSLGSEGPDVGVMSAIESQSKSGKILHYGFDYTDTWLKGIDDGRITAIVDQDAYQIGYQVIENLVKTIDGETIDPTIPIDVKYVPAAELEAYGKEKSNIKTDSVED